MKTAIEVQIVRCEGGWWLAQDASAKLAATGKTEAEARARVNQVVSVFRATMERVERETAPA